MDTPPSTVGPGIGAFIAFFVLALCLWLLMRNMNGRMRRMAYREQQRVADLEAAEAQRAASATAGSDHEAPQAVGARSRRRRPRASRLRRVRRQAPTAQTEPDEPTP